MARNGTNASGKAGKKGKQKKAGEGVLQMFTLADKKLKEKAPEVVDALGEKAAKGNVSCTRLLMDWADRAAQIQANSEAPAGVSLSQTWMSEPEWNGELDELTAETTAGSREPEK